MSPSDYSANSGGSLRSSVGAVRPTPEGSPQKQDRPPNAIVSSKNTQSITFGALVSAKDEENLGNHGPTTGRSEQVKHVGLLHSIDMMEGSHKHVGLGMMPKISGSVARAHAIATGRLWRSKSTQSSFRAGHKNAEMPTEPATDAASKITFFGQENEPSSSIGKWRCCKCGRGHDVHSFSHSQHPIGALNCVCAHRSCARCTLEGLLKSFVPMNEPEVVPLSEDANKVVRFGVFCDGCGLSWRAQEVHGDMNKNARMKCTLQRVTAIPKRLNKRETYATKELRASRSMENLFAFPPSILVKATSKSVLNLRELSNEMEKEHGEQADVVSVRFTGIKCSCSMVTDSNSLCFQIVDPPRDFYKFEFAKQMAGRRMAGFGTTPEDKAKGHGTPTVVLKGGHHHPNPLMSNPVS